MRTIAALFKAWHYMVGDEEMKPIARAKEPQTLNISRIRHLCFMGSTVKWTHTV